MIVSGFSLLSAICSGNMTSLTAKYDIYSPLPSTPDFEIKLHLEVIRENCCELMHVPRFHLLCDLLYCFQFLCILVF